MKKIEKGSTLYMALMCTTFIVLLCTHFWQTTALINDLARKRESYEQRLKATEGLLKYGIAVSKKYLEDPKKDKAFISEDLLFPDWPVGDSRSYEGKIHLNRVDDRIMIRACLYTTNRCVTALRCTVSKKEDTNDFTNAGIVITDWSHEQL